MIECKFPRVTQHFGRELSLDDFQYIQKLGKGTFGQVGLYRHKSSGTQFAIKRIQLEREGKKVSSQEEIIMLTRKELEVLYRLNSPYIIKLLDHFQDNQSVHLITEFVQGLNLYDLTLKTNHHLSDETVAEIVFQLCEGLEELHINHIVHRDIKLQNVMYNGGRVKIVDLGCSNCYADSVSRKTTIGTRLYWSPEVISQQEQNDRLDIWCVGVVMYQLLFLEQPFTGNDIERKIRKCDYSFPGDNRPQPELEDLFKKVFTNKNNRISAMQLKEHPWIKKNRKGTEISSFKFQNYFTQEQTVKYRELVRGGIASNTKFVDQLKPRSEKLQLMLKEARSQLKKK